MRVRQSTLHRRGSINTIWCWRSHRSNSVGFTETFGWVVIRGPILRIIFTLTPFRNLKNRRKKTVKRQCHGLCQRWWYTGPLFGLFKSSLPLYFPISDIVHKHQAGLQTRELHTHPNKYITKKKAVKLSVPASGKLWSFWACLLGTKY